MPLSIAESIKVIGNLCKDEEINRYKNIIYFKGKPKKVNGVMICPECDEVMESPYGMWNGSISCDGDSEKCERSYSWECNNYHNFSWNEEVK